MTEQTYNPMELQDEVLDATEQYAAQCSSPYPIGFCYVSDETLDAESLSANPCGGFCGSSRVSDEALDATEQNTIGVCTVSVVCRISDEALDAASADVAPCVVTCVVPCRISDEMRAAF